MNQKASKYTSIGLSESKEALRADKFNFIKYLMFTVTSIIGKLFFFSFPLFKLSEYHIVHQIKESQTINFEDAFEDSSQVKTYWTMMLFGLIKLFILLTGLVLISALAYGLIALGTAMDTYELRYQHNFILFFQVVSVILYVIFLFCNSLIYAPVGFLIQSHPEMGLREALSQSKVIFNAYGRGKLFVIRIRLLLRFIAYIVLASAVGLISYIWLTPYYFIGIVIILSILLLQSLPRILLSNQIASTRLYLDLIEDSAYQSLFEANPSPLFDNGLRKEDLLSSLFDEVFENETVSEPVEEPALVEAK